MVDLRPYQLKAIEDLKRKRRPLLVAATGSGKTVIAAEGDQACREQVRSVPGSSP